MPVVVAAAAKRATPGTGRTRPRAWLAGACALLLGGIVLDAQAAADCSITSVSLNFGTYDPLFSSPDDSTGSVTVTCRSLSQGATRVNYTVTLSGAANGATPTSRQMTAGTRRLGYNVYTDPARSQAWGTGTAGTVIASGAMTVGPGVGNGGGLLSVTHTVYGRIPQLQDALPGNYADTLLVTLTF